MSGNQILDEEKIKEFLGLDAFVLKRMEETPQNISQDRYDSTLYGELKQASIYTSMLLSMKTKG